ncbi:DUF6503 family protein [Allomuricauda sp. SCSIO 65647]|uniref:DUF6503 family protein n=1 Tax=Allomuricauda sp. SCSIO 65647 TaxID=2908843 RepID=UPI001F15DBAD|nr:DUF6503 family protein [Muricauda sp. SCSIO 65647]UJH67912.1 DUF6503 family protein [Muricauda sp. SCSIO 65647]
MKQFSFLLVLALFLACGEQPKKNDKTESETTVEVVEAVNDYPEALHKIFNAHGGIDLWKRQRTLTFERPMPEAPETHTIDLYTRKDRIDTPKFSMGHDGRQTWLLDGDSAYKGNADFYHNLMFYFYAMPFVMADDGINYGETTPLEFEGKTYPGIAITYNDGVGTSPKDEYYIHYDADTHQMAWLGYTVTYRTGEDSNDIRWLRYEWGVFNGITLPQSISWYNYEGRDIKDLRTKIVFENTEISENRKPTGFYGKPEGAVYVASNKQ